MLQLIWCRWRLLDWQCQVTLHRLHVRLWPVTGAGGRVWAIVKAACDWLQRGGSALGCAICPRNHTSWVPLTLLHLTPLSRDWLCTFNRLCVRPGRVNAAGGQPDAVLRPALCRFCSGGIVHGRAISHHATIQAGCRCKYFMLMGRLSRSLRIEMVRSHALPPQLLQYAAAFIAACTRSPASATSQSLTCSRVGARCGGSHGIC